jgi:hypothetical protein
MRAAALNGLMRASSSPWTMADRHFRGGGTSPGLDLLQHAFNSRGAGLHRCWAFRAQRLSCLKANAAPAGSPWMWTLAFGHHEDRTPTHGYAESRSRNGGVCQELAARVNSNYLRFCGEADTPWHRFRRSRLVFRVE